MTLRQQGSGELLRQERIERGWSQPKLVNELRKQAAKDGHRLPSTNALVSMISRWERGRRQPDVFYQYLLRAVYGKTAAELGFVDPEPEGVLLLPAPLNGELRSALTQPSRIDGALLDDLDALTNSYRRLDRRLGAPAVFQEMQIHLERVRALTASSMSSANRLRLAAITGDVAALAGWQALDMGNATRAWSYLRTAAEAPGAAEHPTLHAFVVAQTGYIPLFSGDGRAALPLMAQARQIAERTATPTFRAWLAGAHAEAFASIAETDECLRALDEQRSRPHLRARSPPTPSLTSTSRTYCDGRGSVSWTWLAPRTPR